MTDVNDRNWTADFEQVEKDAQELVTTLEGLKTETERYRDLNKTIESTSTAVTKLADGLGDIAPGLKDLITTMQTLEIPQLRVDVDDMRSRLDALLKEVTLIKKKAEKASEEATIFNRVIVAGLGILIFLTFVLR